MSAVIGALRGVLSLDSAAFERGVKRAQASMGTLQRSLKRRGESMQRIGRQTSLRVTAPLVGMATIAVRSSLRAVDAQAKMAQSLDTNVVSLQNLQRASDLAGISSGQLEGSLRRMTRRISLAEQGTGPAVDALERLGLSAANLNNIPADQRVDKINSAIRDLIPAAEQAGVASQIFGDLTGLAMLRLDSDVIARATQEIEAFGVAVTDVDASQIEAANDAMSALGLVSRGLANQLTVALAPTLQAIAERAAELGKWFNDLTPETRRMVAAGTALAAALGPAVFTMGLMATGLAALASPIGLVVLGLGAAAGAAAVVAANWDTLTEKYPALETAATRAGEAMRVASDGVKERVSSNVESIGAGVQSVADLFAGDLKSAMDNFLTAVQGIENPLVTAAKSWAKIIKAIVVPEWDVAGFEAIRAFIDGVVQGWKNHRQEIIDFLTLGDIRRSIANGARAVGESISEGLAGGIKDKAGAVASAGRNAARGAIDATKEKVESQSPSRVFMRIGRDLMEGLAIGVRENAQPAIDAARAAAGEMALQASSAVRELPSALGDFFASGLRDFESFADTLTRSFRQLISDLVATAVANPIRLSLGATAAGGVTAATLSTSGTGAVAGLGLLGGLGEFGSALSTGIQGTFMSGLGSILPTIEASLSGIGAGGSVFAGLGTALGAALPVIGAVGLALGAFRTKVEEVGEGVTVALDGMNGLVETFDVVKKSNAFGLNSWKDWEYDPASDELANAILGPINEAQRRIVEMAETVGIGADAFAGFTNAFRVELKGLNDDEAAAAIQEAAQGAIDAFAQMAVAGTSLRREGESASQILERVATSLAVVNPMLERLGMDAFDASLEGGGAASDLANMFGGVQGMASALNTFTGAFYTEGERLALLTQDLERQLAAVNMAMPDTRDEFRAMVEGLDLTSAAGRNAFATMISLSGGFDEVFTAAEDAAQALLDQVAATEKQTKATRDAAQAEEARARQALASSNLSAAESALRGAVSARQTAISSSASDRIAEIQAATEATVQRLLSQADRLGGRASDYRGLRDALTEAIASRRASDAFDPGRSYRRASALLQEAAGRSGIRSMDEIREAMAAVAQPSTDLFTSFTEYQHSFNKNTAALDQIRALAGEELSDAQRQINAIENNAAAIEAAAAEQIASIEASRDAEIGKLNSLLNATLGVETAVLSVGQALRNYTRALAESNAARIAVPAFANGGSHMGGFRLVGERGPELEAAGPSRVFSAGQTRDILRGGGTEREVRALRAEIAALSEKQDEQARDIERTRKVFSKWDDEGLPGERS